MNTPEELIAALAKGGKECLGAKQKLRELAYDDASSWDLDNLIGYVGSALAEDLCGMSHDVLLEVLHENYHHYFDGEEDDDDAG